MFCFYIWEILRGLGWFQKKSFTKALNSSSSKLFWWFLHPRNLTWNPKRSPQKRQFPLETIIFRFHVKFRGIIYNIYIYIYDFHSRYISLTNPRGQPTGPKLYETFRATHAGRHLGLTSRQGGKGHFQPGWGLGFGGGNLSWKIGGWYHPPKWMVYNFIRENPVRIDDLGVPLFLETPKYIYIYTDSGKPTLAMEYAPCSIGNTSSKASFSSQLC